MLNTKMTQIYLYSRDNEQDGTQFLQIGATMAKLWPLLNCELFMKCIFGSTDIYDQTYQNIFCGLLSQ